jgi:hypothetical protein
MTSFSNRTQNKLCRLQFLRGIPSIPLAVSVLACLQFTVQNVHRIENCIDQHWTGGKGGSGPSFMQKIKGYSPYLVVLFR